MNITEIKVPKGIRYLSDWTDFKLERFPHIIDKQIPGCGFTEFCLTNNQDLILCCPRKMILENKMEQHKGEVYYAKSVLSSDPNVDKDISQDDKHFKYPNPVTEAARKKAQAEIAQREYLRMRGEIEAWWYRCQGEKKPCKVLVTYDSYRKIKDILIELGVFDQFYTVIDEMQAVFVDSRFKSDTEMEFLHSLRGVEPVCYVSATPMLETYLDQLEEFKDLPYYRLDWKSLDEGRVSKPNLKIYSLRSSTTVVRKIVGEYRSGKLETSTVIDEITGQPRIIKSREAVFYINSVNSIIRAIKAVGLLPWEVNILCADTPENQSRIKKMAQEIAKENPDMDLKGQTYEVGKVPLKGTPHKMFTFCTRTVYLGADFYSDNARSFILSDANVDSMAVDISLDLPQILGRQRLKENPWKNKAELYIKTLRSDMKSMEEFKTRIEEKKKKSANLLKMWSEADTEDKRRDLSEVFERDAITSNYRYNYVAVNRHDGTTPKAVFNNLALVAEQRAYDIQQVDYADRFTVFNILANTIDVDQIGQELLAFNQGFYSIKTTHDRIKYLCEYKFPSRDAMNAILDSLEDDPYRSAYLILGPARCKSLSYNSTLIKGAIKENLFDKTRLGEAMVSRILVGEKRSKAEWKEIVNQIYSAIGYNKSGRAIDLEEWFEIGPCRVKDQTGKWTHGYEIINIK